MIGFKYFKKVGKNFDGKEIIFYVREDARELFEQAPEGSFTRTALSDYILDVRAQQFIKSRLPLDLVIEHVLGMESL